MRGFIAMAQIIKKRTINLLPNKGDGIVNQFLSWALSIGRLLIIITEAAALTVFVLRFTLDVQIIDLHDKIEAQSSIVRSFQENEALFRNIQSRLAFAKEYDSQKDTTLTLLKDILAMGQNKVTFRTLTVGKETIEIEMQSPSSSLLAEFTDGLKTHPEIQGVNISRVENKTASGVIILGMTAERKIQKAKIQAPTDLSDKSDDTKNTKNRNTNTL